MEGSSRHSPSVLAAPQRSIEICNWPASLSLSVSLPRVGLFSWPTYTELPVWTHTEGRAKQQQHELSFKARFNLKCALNLTTSPLSPDGFYLLKNTRLFAGCTDADKQHISRLSLVLLTHCQMMCWFNSVVTFKAVVCLCIIIQCVLLSVLIYILLLPEVENGAIKSSEIEVPQTHLMGQL